MQLAFRLLGLMWHLAAILRSSLEHRLHPRQESQMKDLGSYEIVTPLRVNDFGEPFPHAHHYRRRRRSADVDITTGMRTHYSLDAFGQRFHLNLSADAGFIAPSYGLMHLGDIRGRSNSSEPGDMRHCFYSGHVNGRSDFRAVFSLCSGLIGTFTTPSGEYFLEPLMRTEGEGAEHEDEHNKPHLVYRHVRSNKSEPCAASDKHEDGKVHLQGSRSMEEQVHAVQQALDHAHAERHVFNHRNQSRSRQKRFLSYPRYVELMVTADAKMSRHHGQNLEHYILTIMSVVAAVYRDPSVGNLINIVIVKLIVIHNEQDGPSISFNAATTLHNFCVWQQSQNVQDDSHPSHHDTALLITREDICRAKDKCDTLGLAELGTMCDPFRSCSISEENGLSSSFTIAHELGHVFNMPHDDNPKCKEAGIKHQYHVMAPMLNDDTSPWSWSRCSRKYITEFLDTGYGECLLDEPASRPYSLSTQLPGQLYNANRQCELLFGPGSQVCPYMKQCKRLWCTSAEGDHKGCRTQHMPLADGTDCGHRMHCRHGMCVNKEAETRPVHGEWGPWGPYSACSRTCGGGTRSTTRDCNKPEPRNGGRFCVGRRMKFRSCSTEPCPRGRRDFREEQCAAFDGRHFNINGLTPNVRWVPKYSGILMKDRCRLFCRVSGKTAYYQLRDRVTDGTQCGPETNDICVQGLCRQAGCDHVLNSKARNDKCGVCGGDNSSCKTLAGTFNSSQYGYNVVVRIPAGANNIDIKQVSYSGKPEDDNYLALSDSQSNFILNGNFVVAMFKREVAFKGTVIEYSGSDTKVERINCTERIEEELVLQVLCVGNLYNPDVRYSFNIPIDEQHQQFEWSASGAWQECSRTCKGERSRKLLCMRKSDHLVVSDQRCYHITRPTSLSEPCNTDCEFRWHVAGRSECSAQCGPGYRTLDVQCMKYSLVRRQNEVVEGRYCEEEPKPPTREPCHGDCLLQSWHYGAWSQCSKTCGRGTRTRDSYCMNNLGRRLVDRECGDLQQLATEVCGDVPCADWSASEWSECLVTCGKGMKHREVVCSLGEERLSDRRCRADSKPPTVDTCHMSECASWQVGAWGTCSVTCGHGYQMRAVRCVTGGFGQTLDDRACNAASRPTDSQDCDLTACARSPADLSTEQPADPVQLTTQWRHGSWTTCSVSCGKGKRARYVSCRDAQGGVADESYCVHLPRPPESSVCFQACGQWRAGEWSPCSVSCGVGRSTRQVICGTYHHQVEEDLCNPEERPSSDQECTAMPCPSSYQPNPSDGSKFPQQNHPYDPGSHPGHSTWNVPSADNQWRTGPWGGCSSTCAGGFQRRVVVCQDLEGHPSHHCEERVKPAEAKSCDSGPCPQWNYGIWGECTQSCGGGRRTRLVVCQWSSGQRLSEHSCDILERPPDVERCNTQPCPGSVSWHRRPWKPCSVSCGIGVKQRDITCVDENQAQVEERLCLHLLRPRSQKSCRARRCPCWKANRWGECSSICGPAVQKREVYCRLKGVGRVHEDLCDPLTRPPGSQYCAVLACPGYTWLAGEWQDCSVTCGDGVNTRDVTCVDEGGRPVHQSLCNVSSRPELRQACSLPPCQYVWTTGDWSQCSASCGPGFQQRMVSCIQLPSAIDSALYAHQALPLTECPTPHPAATQACNLGVCPASWSVGSWGKCSQTCGAGVMERRVECVNVEGLTSESCQQGERPESRAACQERECELFATCKEVQLKQGARNDGEYHLRVKSRILQIYCAEMQSKNPKEYVTLRGGQMENFSEVYGYRLQDPYSCPSNGSRNPGCACSNDYPAAGYTLFHRIRLDVSTMRVITTDLRFSQTRLGRPVPFATAGDCYSAAKCPQGQFSINLAGSGLKVAMETKWASQGNYVNVKVHRSQDGTRVYGRCGGFCGKCSPQSGLHVQIH